MPALKCFDEIEHDGRQLRYELRRRRRRTLEIAVHPDLRVVVVAPLGAPLARVRAVIRKRALWIKRQLRELSLLHPLPVPRQFVSGETHRYLGRQYRLRIRRRRDESVKLAGGRIRVTLRQPSNPRAVRDLVNGWYQKRAKAALPVRVTACTGPMRRVGIEIPPVVIRWMRTRWGSCTSARRLLLNVELVKVPVACIDYVIVHELCHLKLMGHDAGFQRLLSRIMPDWEERRRRLDRQEV